MHGRDRWVQAAGVPLAVSRLHVAIEGDLARDGRVCVGVVDQGTVLLRGRESQRALTQVDKGGVVAVATVDAEKLAPHAVGDRLAHGVLRESLVDSQPARAATWRCRWRSATAETSLRKRSKATTRAAGFAIIQSSAEWPPLKPFSQMLRTRDSWTRQEARGRSGSAA